MPSHTVETKATYVRNMEIVVEYMRAQGISDIPVSAGIALIGDMLDLWASMTHSDRDYFFSGEVVNFVHNYIKWVTAGNSLISDNEDFTAETVRRLKWLGLSLYANKSATGAYRDECNKRGLLGGIASIQLEMA